MSNPPSRDGQDPAMAESLSELRELLFGTEKTHIDEIRNRLEDPELQAQDVGRVLPKAIRLRAAQDDRLVPALRATVEEILHQSVKRNPDFLVQTLFPIMGPAIRKSITSALRGMVQSLEQTLELSVSPRSIKWRVEAYRTGRSFSEIVLLHTLQFRVEQVFLIHRSTGLVLQHVVAKDAPSQDPDLVSGMLTAIQDFVRDSFEVTETSGLESLEFGDLSVWIEQGPMSVIAAVIRGNAPLELRADLQNAIEQVHFEFEESLTGFEGETGPFDAAIPLLERCLQYRTKEASDESTRSGGSRLLWGLLAILVVALGFWLYRDWREHQRWSDYLAELRSQPGIVITEAQRGGGSMLVEGLRDPLAVDPAVLLSETELDPNKVESRWESYVALNDAIIQRRATLILAPPASTQLAVEDGTLRLSGAAPAEWIDRAKSEANRIAGVNRVELGELQDPVVEEIRRRSAEMEEVRISFTRADRLSDGQDALLDSVRQQLDQLNELAAQKSVVLVVRIVGLTDELGTRRQNEIVGRRRASSLLETLRDSPAKWQNLAFELTSAVEMGAASNRRGGKLEVETSILQ